MKCNWKTLQKNKCRFLHSEWRFLHSIFFRSVLNCLLKQIATEIVLHLKFRNLHSEWRFLHSNVFQKRFWFVFLKKHLQGIFSIQNGEISILNEDLSIHFFFRSGLNFKKNLYREFLHSIFFRSVLNFFFEKQTPQIIFSIQNGEISILNGDFSIQFFFRRVLNFKKNIYREFSPFLNGDFSIQMFFRSVFVFFGKKPLQGIFSIQNGEISILNEDFSIHFFQKCFDLKKKHKLHSTNNFLHLEWRNLHSEWRFLHSNFFRSVSNLFFLNVSLFFLQSIFSIQSFSETFRTFFWNLSLFFLKSIFSIQNGEISI